MLLFTYYISYKCTKQFAHLKYMVQWFLEYSELCDHHQYQFQNIFTSPDEIPCPLAVSPYSFIFHSWQPLVHFPFLYIGQF
jgi:hypothetical protein